MTDESLQALIRFYVILRHESNAATSFTRPRRPSNPNKKKQLQMIRKLKVSPAFQCMVVVLQLLPVDIVLSVGRDIKVDNHIHIGYV